MAKRDPTRRPIGYVNHILRVLLDNALGRQDHEALMTARELLDEADKAAAQGYFGDEEDK